MPLDDRDLAYIIDMLGCVSDIMDFTDDISFGEFESDKMRKLAVERQLEVIGQAAGKISADLHNRFPEIPWPRIVGLRNKLAHDYGDILAKRIWDISRSAVPRLREQLLAIPEVHEYLAESDRK